jgi:transposase
VPEAKEKIVFDKFHIAKHLHEAVDKVRRLEARLLRRAGDDLLMVIRKRGKMDRREKWRHPVSCVSCPS